MFNSSTSSAPVNALLKAYFKIPFLPIYSSCFTLTSWLLDLTTMQLLPFLLMMSLSSLQPVKKKMLSSTQPVVTSVVIWSREWKLNLNADKSEIFPFSTWSNNSNWNPTIFTDTQKVRVNTTHRLFGAILDRNLTFNAHSKTLTASVTSSIRIIRTAHTSGGWHRSTLKKAFHASGP